MLISAFPLLGQVNGRVEKPRIGVHSAFGGVRFFLKFKYLRDRDI